MNDIAIKVEELGKLYRLGEVGTGTISHDLNRWIARVRGKEDPFARIGESNDRTKKGESDYVWALKDVSFDIRQGEAVGIIGRNGAGKSTLLKLLSKVTKPTHGRIKVKGRIASLLEVGTGFHPEMTGRENIFLNGAIMGMTKREIRTKFDEIVDFAGVERYIDTPVKRYSSGMYVRLAFAVAAHLEPEILIVDEVLAVGDAEFQKKCLGKMKDVSESGGRTVLFVSHNMGAIQQLCTSAVLLKNGGLELSSDVPTVINRYITSKETRPEYVGGEDNKAISVLRAAFTKAGKVTSSFRIDESPELTIEYRNTLRNERAILSLSVTNKEDQIIFVEEMPLARAQGRLLARFPTQFLKPDEYYVSLVIHEPNVMIYESLVDLLRLEISDSGDKFSKYGSIKNGLVYGNVVWAEQ